MTDVDNIRQFVVSFIHKESELFLDASYGKSLVAKAQTSALPWSHPGIFPGSYQLPALQTHLTFLFIPSFVDSVYGSITFTHRPESL